MEKYETPEMEIIKFEKADIIITSSNNGNNRDPIELPEL